MPNPFDFRQEMLRLDYQPSGAHRLTGAPAVRPLQPDRRRTARSSTRSCRRSRPTASARAATSRSNHYWTIGNNLVNEAKFNYSGNGQKIPPVGDAWKRSTPTASSSRSSTPGGGDYENSIPNVDMQRLRHASAARTPSLAVADVGLLVHGQRHLDQGRAHPQGRRPRRSTTHKDQNGRSDYTGHGELHHHRATPTRPATPSPTRCSATSAPTSEAQLDPIGYFRFWQFEAFVSDAGSIDDKLSVEVRRPLRVPDADATPTGNNTTSFDPALLQRGAGRDREHQRHDRARHRQPLQRPDAAGRRAVRPGGRTCRTPTARSSQSIPIADNRGLLRQPATCWRRASASPARRAATASTSIRGGVGPVLRPARGQPVLLAGRTTRRSRSARRTRTATSRNPGGGTAAALAPWGSIDSLDPEPGDPARVELEPERASVSCRGGACSARSSYVGNKGQNLLRQPDINQPSLRRRYAANAAGPEVQRRTTCVRTRATRTSACA